MICEKCRKQVDPDRAEFLSETDRPMVCASCSKEKKALTVMEYGHKTAPGLVVVKGGGEQARLALRAHRRSR